MMSAPAMSPAIPSVYSQTLRLITEGVVMPRTRVHNMNVSLDGYAAGEQVSFDAPIGGAERLFTWFDGRVIHGVDKADAPRHAGPRSDQHVEPGNRRRDHGTAQV